MNPLPNAFTLYQRPTPSKKGWFANLRSQRVTGFWQALHRPVPVMLGMTISLLFGVGMGGYFLSVRQTVAAMSTEKAVMEESLTAELALANQTIAEYQVALDEKVGEYYALEAQIEAKEDALAGLKAKLSDLNSKAAKESVLQIQAMYSALQALQEKATRYAQAGIKTADLEAAYAEWKEALFRGEIAAVMEGIAKWDGILQTRFDRADSYHASVGRSEESRGEIQTPVGLFSYTLVRAPINGTVVQTVSATADNCQSDCSAVPLGQLVASVEGVAGINGTYFCPPDYSACARQKNYTFSPLVESRTGQWVDPIKRLWNFQSGIGFVDNQPTFYPDAADMPLVGLQAGVANYPALVQGGAVVASVGNTDTKQRIKATRAAFGYDEEWYYLVVIKQATVVESAHVLAALGAEYALTLDGGGSAALIRDGRYLEGPGRPIPNAIVFK